MNNLLDLAHKHFGCEDIKSELLPVSGSARRYYRLFVGDNIYVGVEHFSREENILFLDFSERFGNIDLCVPKIIAVSEDRLTYIQEDLGSCMLLNVVEDDRNGDFLGEKSIEFYKKSIKELLKFQMLGHRVVNYENCVPRPVFDKRAMLWDLHYFKYCFLLLYGIAPQEDALQNDFESLLNKACSVDASSFMFRDFQSRNIMIKDDKVIFIDYQGGRQGALHYDLASLLYDPIVNMCDEQRIELLDYYLQELRAYKKVDEDKFKKDFYCFALIRLFQALGAFGLRGLYEKKQHFIDSIFPGLHILSGLLKNVNIVGQYPEIERVIALSCKKSNLEN